MSAETQEPNSPTASPPQPSDVKEPLRFEQLISDLSVRIVGATAETLDDTIEMALGHLGRHLRLGLATVLCLDPKRNVFTHTHEWYDEELFEGTSFLETDVGEQHLELPGASIRQAVEILQEGV